MATTIDANWLSGKTAPYVLGTDNEVYTLAVDVNVTTNGFFGQPFKLTGKNVQLIRGTYKVQVNGVDVDQIDDTRFLRQTSVDTRRIDTTKPVKTFGGTYFDGGVARPVTPAGFVPIVPYADTL